MIIGNSELRINPASLANAFALQKALGRALKDANLSFDVGDFKKLDQAVEKLLPTLANGLLAVITSDEVEAALFRCAEKALLGDKKVDRDFFEDVENRQYYFPIMIEVIKVNVGPFFKTLSSMFPDLGGKVLDILKQDSQTTP